jgi:hypothetical protein
VLSSGMKYFHKNCADVFAMSWTPQLYAA